MSKTALTACFCLSVLLLGCGREKENWEKREQVTTDKTPEEWLEIVQGKNTPARMKAMEHIVEYQKQGEDMVSELVKILDNSKNGVVMKDVSRTLGLIGKDAEAAVPVLCEKLKRTQWDARDVAAEARGKINSRLDQTIPALAGALKDEDPRVRGKASEALGKIAQTDSRAIQAIVDTLEDEDGNVRAHACDALGKLGAKAKDAIPALEKAAKSADFATKSAAEHALGKIRGQ